MPSLSPEQFRLFDPGPALAGPDPSEGSPVQNANPPRGQGILPLEGGGGTPMFTGPGGVTPVNESSDPDYSSMGFQIGGMQRATASGAWGTNSSLRERAQGIVDKWEGLPVETFPSGTEIRSGQLDKYDSTPTGRTASGRAWRPNKNSSEFGDSLTVEIDDDHLGNLRGSTQFHDPEDPARKAKHPWVVEARPRGNDVKRYLVEGNHRTAAMRETGSGDMQAHVYRGKPGKSLDAVTRDFIDEMDDW